MTHGSTGQHGGPRWWPLTPQQEARLLDVALRRIHHQPWRVIADEMGWNSKQAAQKWAKTALRRYFEGKAHDRRR